MVPIIPRFMGRTSSPAFEVPACRWRKHRSRHHWRPAEQRRAGAQAAEQDDSGNHGQQQHAPRMPADPDKAQDHQDPQTAMKPMTAHKGAIRPVAKNKIDIASSPASARPPST